MKGLGFFWIVMLGLLSCSPTRKAFEQPLEGRQNLVVRPIEGKWLLLSPPSPHWSKLQYEAYTVAVDFCSQTGEFLRSPEMLRVYVVNGPLAHKDRFVAVLKGGYSEEGDVVEYGWRNRFRFFAIRQIEALEVDAGLPPMPDSALVPDAYTVFANAVIRRADLIFKAGIPCCMIVGEPAVYPSQTKVYAKVRVRLYASEDLEDFVEVGSQRLMFEKSGDVWNLTRLLGR